MCAKDNDRYYGSVEWAKWGDARRVSEPGGLRQTCLTFGPPVGKYEWK